MIDWYPSLDLKIEGHKIKADFDTGAKGLFLSEQFLSNIGVEQSLLNFTQKSYHLGSTFQYYIKKLKVSIKSTSSYSIEKEIPCYIVKNFENSPLTLVNKKRQALIGRDIINHFKPLTIELDIEKKTTQVILKDWKLFEKEVADLYCLLGLNVKRNINLAGNQIDVFLEESTSSGKIIKTIIECKYYTKPVGIKEVRVLSSLFEFARNLKLADHAVLVSSSGFTKDAYLVAEKGNIELLEINDLRSKVLPNLKKGDNLDDILELSKDIEEPEKESKLRKIAFVIMPFKEEFNDIYILGIREVLDKFGYSCTRADEVQFNGRIIDKIFELIREADIIIAELTEPNPNVYYELGIAHSHNKNVILCTQEISSAPFDIIDLNHITYNNIIELRENLNKRIESLITNVNAS